MWVGGGGVDQWDIVVIYTFRLLKDVIVVYHPYVNQ